MKPANVEIPVSIDWRELGAVTNVKNQKHCGSCWSFASTGGLEGQMFRKTGVLESLSEQNLIDCSKSYNNEGCNGGLMGQTYQYIIDNGGIDSEESYPYESINSTCRYDPKNSVATVSGFVNIERGNEDKLTSAIATVGPIPIAIDASHSSFQLYKSGVYYNSPHCSSTFLDHAVLAVGYGTDDSGQDYYIVKNSWGTGWGENGYIKMARNRHNHCGVATSAVYPLV